MVRERLAPFFAYSGVALLSAGLVAAGMRLDKSSLADPLGYNGGDVMLILPMVQSLSESGSPWFHPRLSAPEGQDLRDFPVIDYLHFAGIRALQLAGCDLMTAFNVYFLLGYPLAALTAAYALRRLGLSWPAAVVGAVLFAFTPYHQARNLGHYFLSAYYVVPLTILLAVEVALNRVPADARRWRAGAAVIGLLTAISGAYYAYFGCALLAFAGCYAAWAAWRWGPLVRASGVVAVIVAVGVLAHLPSIRHQAEVGRNPAPTFRLADEAETYGLKLTQLVLPIRDHRLTALAAVRVRYDSPQRPVQTENATGTLGLFASLGLIGLLASLVLPTAGPTRALAAVMGFLILFGTVGGLGAVFNHLVSAQVRAYCRVSIFIAFLALHAGVWALDGLRMNRLARWAAFAVVGTLGFLDQVGSEWFTPRIAEGRQSLAFEYEADREFYSQVDGVDGAMVFCLPYIAYPETTQVGALMGYDHARGVIHTARARWSFGAMKGRAADEWLRDTSQLPLGPMLDRVVARGFTHLYVHTKGYPRFEATRLVRQAESLLGAEAELAPHTDGYRRLFDLRDYARRRQAELGSPEALADLGRVAVRPEWLTGFMSFEPPRQESRIRLMRPDAELVLVNSADKVKRLKIEFAAKTLGGESVMTVDGGKLWRSEFPVSAQPSEHVALIAVPPGRHALHWRCPRPAGWLPGDGRQAVAMVADFTMTPADDTLD